MLVIKEINIKFLLNIILIKAILISNYGDIIKMPTEIERFFKQHPVFTREFFDQSIGAGVRSKHTLKNILAHHLRRGHIVRIKRGLFASIPYGADYESYPINPYLIAGHLADDAIIGYHTALSYYGASYSSSYRFIYLTQSKQKALKFRDIIYQPTQPPAALISLNQMNCYVNKEDVQDMDLLVTSKERTMVDIMDRPLLGGGWEEIWRSLDMLKRLKVQTIIDYVLMLNVATTIAKVGFYLEQKKESLSVTEEQLEKLVQHCPLSPHYLKDNSASKYKLIRRWNLMVPESIVHRNWEEKLNWEPKT